MMRMHKIRTQFEYVMIFIISFIFCISVIFYYINLPRNRFSESIFIYLFFILLKICRAYDLPKFLELKKGL